LAAQGKRGAAFLRLTTMECVGGDQEKKSFGDQQFHRRISPVQMKSGHFSKTGVNRCADDTETANEHGSNLK